MSRPRVAVVTSHPIQYNGPLFRRVAERGALDLTVIYCSTLGLADNTRPIEAFARAVSWDVDLLSGYRHVFLRGAGGADPQQRRTVVNPDVIAHLIRGRYDVMVGFGWAYPTLWLAYLTGKLLGLPYLLYSDTDVRRYEAGATRNPKELLYRLVCRHAAGALYTGTFNREFYIRFGMRTQQLWFSPWAVDNSRFAGADRASSRASLGLREGVLYALFVGTLIPRKSPLLLLDAIKRLQDEGLQLGLVIAGDGPLRAEVAKRACALDIRDTHILGFVNQARLPSVYAAADVFVLPSVTDARGTVVNEAMAAGLPVIVSDGIGVWGPGDLVEHGHQGLVFRGGDVADLMGALRQMTQEGERMGLATAGRRRVAKWSYDVAADGWEAAVAHLTTTR